MKILALGGCGDMGRHAVQALYDCGLFGQIIIGDIQGKKAEAFAQTFVSDTGTVVGAKQVDIADVRSLRAALQGVDLVLNTTGPFFRFGVAVLTACIEQGCHYLDINDDWEPTLQMLVRHADAEKAGITAVIGMGASPGVSNLMALQAARELDVVDTIYTGWDLNRALPAVIAKEPSAATIHGLHQLSGKIRVFADGQYKDVKPVRKVELDYPGLGRRTVWTVGHPEAVTLPRTIDGIRHCGNIMTASRSTVWGIKALGWLIDRGMVSVPRAAHWAEIIEGTDPGESSEEILSHVATGTGRDLPPVFAVASGSKDGVAASVACTISSGPAGGMGGITGVPLAAAGMLFARDKMTNPGVFAPEGAIEPADLFAQLAPLCEPTRSADDFVIVTRSWEAVTLREKLDAAD